MSVVVAIALGAVIGLALGLLVSATTEVPLAPEVGAVLGGLIGWLSVRNRALGPPRVRGVEVLAP
jgi:large-conductance mechanosensitive channel